ncbi:LysR substrate-binding domain-containing protein [Microvirga sp. Mcv34]|uniref:LysR substrate-binding domain-containing protein n=1 Tax=Microvirga sp. Mcv34 TaxID=2926016 RepID=UPI0021C69C6F|nr:LysR substrate-binding domain-containing protein [Microvirga sp. Mcv34]
MGRRRLPSLKGLQAFEAFARAGSMVRAAEELSVTHGAVSRQIKALEQQLGAKLLTGPRHNLSLTPAGRELAASLSAAFDQISAGLPGAAAREELVISSPGTFAMKWLIPRLAHFVEANPEVQVRILEDSGPPEFGRGGVQAAIRLHRSAAPPGVQATPFLDHAYGPVLSPALFETARDAPMQILRLPRLHSETFPQGWDQWAVDAGLKLPPPSAERSFEHNSYMLEAVASGLGVAVTAWAFAQADIENGRLIAPWGFKPLASRFTYLRPSLASHPAAERFGTWLVAEGRRANQPPAPLF